MTPPGLDLKQLFDLWMDSPLKVQIVSFYHRNPGMIETVEGLAQRIGSDPEMVRKTVQDHVKLGFLRERNLGTMKVIVYDPSGEKKLQDYVAQQVKTRGRTVAG
jgi:hypothetical protein